MTITKKEKILIFVLILFLLVGGIFTLGIMPKNNDTKAVKEEIETLRTEIENEMAKVNASSLAKFNQLVSQIEQHKAVLDALSNPSNNVNVEVESGNLPGQSDAYEVKKFVREQVFAQNGIGTGDFNVPQPSVSSGKIVYNITTSFECDNIWVLEDFVDLMAQRVSYNISSLTFSSPKGKIEGNMRLTITFLNIG